MIFFPASLPHLHDGCPRDAELAGDAFGHKASFPDLCAQAVDGPVPAREEKLDSLGEGIDRLELVRAILASLIHGMGSPGHAFSPSPSSLLQ